MTQCSLSDLNEILNKIEESFELLDEVNLNDLESEISDEILEGFTFKEFQDNDDIITLLKENGVNIEELLNGSSSNTYSLKSNIVKNISTYKTEELFKGIPIAEKYFEGYFNRLIVRQAIIGTGDVDHYVSSDKELSDNFQNLKNTIFLEIQSFLKDEGLLTTDPINLFENGRIKDYSYYSQIMNMISDYFFSGNHLGLFSFSNKLIPNLNIDLANNENKFKAYSNAIILSNFDSIINTTFKNMIEINYNLFNHLNSFLGDEPKYRLKISAKSLLYWNQDTHDSKSSENKEDQLTKMIIESIPMYNKRNKRLPASMEMKDLYLFASMIHNFELKFGNKFKNSGMDFEYFNVNPTKSLLWYINEIKKAINRDSGHLIELNSSLRTDNKGGYTFKNLSNVVYSLDNFINDPELKILEKENTSDQSILTIISQVINNNYGATYSVFNSKSGLSVENMYQQDFNSTSINNTVLGYMKQNVLTPNMYNLKDSAELERFNNLFKDLNGTEDVYIHSLNYPSFSNGIIQYINEKIGLPLSNSNFIDIINDIKDNKNLDYVSVNLFRNQLQTLINTLNSEFTIDNKNNTKTKINKKFKDYVEGTSELRAGNIISQTVADPFYKAVSSAYLMNYIVKPVMNIETAIGNKVPSFKTTTLTFKDTEILNLQRQFEARENTAFRSLLLKDSAALLGTSTKLEAVNEVLEESKNAVKMTVKENFISDLKYEFWESILENDTFQIILGNYSDKNTVFTKVINANFRLENSEYTIVEESIETILETIRVQGKNFYYDTFKKIFSDYRELFSKTGFEEQAKQLEGGSFSGNIEIVNSVLNNNKITDLLSTYANLDYSLKDPDLTITEELHYSKYNGKTVINQLLADNLKIFSSTKLFNEFINHQENSFVNKYNTEIGSNILTLPGVTNKDFDPILAKLKINKSEYDGDKDLVRLKSGNLNPLVRKWMWLNALFRNEYLFVTAKGEYMHPHKNDSQIRTGDFNKDYWSKYFKEMSGRLSSMAKRNVIFTAVIEVPSRNSKKGVPDKINVAAIEDHITAVFTPSGHKKYTLKGEEITRGQDAHDGASYIDDTYSRMIEASYPGKGYSGTKKQFGTLITPYGITIKKDAESVINNDTIRNSFNSSLSLLNKKQQMLGIPLSDIVLDWEKSFNDIYFIDKGDLVKIDKLVLNHNGINNQLVLYTSIKKDGSLYTQPTKTVDINTLFDIWNNVGSIYSTDSKRNYNEGSNDVLYDVVTEANEGELKSKIIHVLSNKSALKAGATNLNSSKYWTNNSTLMYSTYDSRFMGPQLDASHGTDSSEIKEITQLISALAQGGLTSEVANKVYSDIANVIKKAASPYIEGLGSDNSDLYNYLSTKFVDTILISKGESLAKSLIYSIKEDGISIPFSNANFFNLFVKDVVTRLNNEFISRYYSGVGSILLPSQGVIQVYDRLITDENGNQRSVVMTQADLIQEALNNYNEAEFIEKYNRLPESNEDIINTYKEEIFKQIPVKIDQIEIGDTISVYGMPYTITTPEQYYKFKKKYINAGILYKIPSIPRDLKPTLHTFKVNGLSRNVFDFDSTRLLFKLKDVIDIIKNKNQVDIDDDVQILHNFANYIADKNGNEYSLIDNLNEDGLPVLTALESYIRRWNQREYQLLDKGLTMKGITVSDDLNLYFNGDNFTDTIDDVLPSYMDTVIPVSDVVFKPAEKIVGDIYLSNFNRNTNDSMYSIYKQGANYFRNQYNKYFEKDDTEADLKIFTSKSDNPIYIKFVDKVGPLDRNINIKKSLKTDRVLKNVRSRYNELGEEVYSFSDTNNIRVSTDENGNEVIYIKYGTLYENQRRNLKGYHKTKSFERNLKEIIKSFGGSIQAIIPLINRGDYKVDIFTYGEDKKDGKRIINGTTELNLGELSVKIFKAFIGINTIEDNLYDENWFEVNKEKILDKISNQKFASWQKSHDLIDARIPGQSMQSFMPMRNIAYMNTSQNDSYVSILQIYLQGSDFDIDKAYTLGSGFTSDGKIELWSNLSSYSTIEQLNELEKLPLPTEKETMLVEDGSSDINVTEDYNKIANSLVNQDYTYELPAQTITLFNNLIRKINATPNNKISIDLESSVIPFATFVSKINQHNISRDFINGQEAVKNSVVSGIKQIISNPSNQVLANNPVNVQEWHDAIKKVQNKRSKQAINQNLPKINIYSGTGEKSKVIQSNINFKESKSSNYRDRTIENASADATIAIAIDFNTSGEKLTRSSVLNQGKKYIDIDFNYVNQSDEFFAKTVWEIVNELNSINIQPDLFNEGISLNIAGNGIYTLSGRYTQEEVDNFTYQLLKAVTESPNLRYKISSIRTGGQTGFDEAGAKAGEKLGIPTTVLAPKGWKFRTESGDISDKAAFINRFNIETTSDEGDEVEKDDENVTEEYNLSSYDMLSYYIQQYNASVGKDDVGIAANGVKTFYALSSYYNTYYKNNEFETDLSTSFKTFNKELSFYKNGIKSDLGGIFTNIADVQISQSQLEMFKQFNPNFTVRYVNGANNLSGFLSAATDNAKELIMAKVNASTDLAAMHIYLMIIGLNIDQVVEIMTSSVMGDIVKGMESNIFENTDKQSFYRVVDILKNKYKRAGDMDSANNLDTYSNIYRSAQEITILSRMLGINQKRAANTWEIYEYLNLFPRAINDIEKKISKKTWEAFDIAKNTDFIVKELIKLNPNVSASYITDTIQKAASLNIMRNGFDFEKYFSDSDYKQVTKEYYNLFKETFNVFDVIDSVPHFKEMVNSMILFHNLLKRYSSKYNYIFTTFRENTKMNIPSEISLIKAISYYDTRAREEWLQSENMLDFNFNVKELMRMANKTTFSMYTSSEAKDNFYKDKYTQIIDLDDDSNPILTLSSMEGVANFKNMFEQLLLPILQSNLKENNFLKIDSVLSQFGNKMTIIAPTVPLSSSNVPTLVEQFQKVLTTFDNLDRSSEIKFQIKNSTGEYIKWRDLLFVYNLLVNNERYGDKRITPLFQNYMQEKNTLGYDYVKFWSSIDKGFNLIEDYSVKDIQFFVNNKKGTSIIPKIVATNSDYVLLSNLEESEQNRIFYADIKEIVRLLKEGGYVITLKC